MSVIGKRFTIFCAEYLIVAEGFVFLGCIYTLKSLSEKLSAVLSALAVLTLSLCVARVIKIFIKKDRPLGKLFIPTGRYAFPSGHATGLFSVTFFIFTESYTLGILALIISLVIVIARIKSKVHDLKDIVGGAIIGTLVTYSSLPYIATYVGMYVVPSISW